MGADMGAKKSAEKGATLVTGACGGLGGAFVRVLAARGEPLFLTGRSAERLAALQGELQTEYPALPVQTFACDLASSAEREALFAYADGRGVKISRLVYVAGIDTQKAAEKYTEEKLVMQARVNFEGAVSLARMVAERADGACELLAVGSMSAASPMPYFALYSASKKALEQYFVALHSELRGRAKVTVVLPGGIPTREDIRENIAAHGWFGRVSQLPPETVAVRSLKALSKNRRRVVIGGWNKLLVFLMRLAPLSWKMRVIARIWSRTEKDAF